METVELVCANLCTTNANATRLLKENNWDSHRAIAAFFNEMVCRNRPSTEDAASVVAFVSQTGADRTTARNTLAGANWDVNDAICAYLHQIEVQKQNAKQTRGRSRSRVRDVFNAVVPKTQPHKLLARLKSSKSPTTRADKNTNTNTNTNTTTTTTTTPKSSRKKLFRLKKRAMSTSDVLSVPNTVKCNTEIVPRISSPVIVARRTDLPHLIPCSIVDNEPSLSTQANGLETAEFIRGDSISSFSSSSTFCQRVVTKAFPMFKLMDSSVCLGSTLDLSEHNTMVHVSTHDGERFAIRLFVDGKLHQIEGGDRSFTYSQLRTLFIASPNQMAVTVPPGLTFGLRVFLALLEHVFLVQFEGKMYTPPTHLTHEQISAEPNPTTKTKTTTTTTTTRQPRSTTRPAPMARAATAGSTRARVVTTPRLTPLAQKNPAVQRGRSPPPPATPRATSPPPPATISRAMSPPPPPESPRATSPPSSRATSPSPPSSRATSPPGSRATSPPGSRATSPPPPRARAVSPPPKTTPRSTTATLPRATTATLPRSTAATTRTTRTASSAAIATRATTSTSTTPTPSQFANRTRSATSSLVAKKSPTRAVLTKSQSKPAFTKSPSTTPPLSKRSESATLTTKSSPPLPRVAMLSNGTTSTSTTKVTPPLSKRTLSQTKASPPLQTKATPRVLSPRTTSPTSPRTTNTTTTTRTTPRTTTALKTAQAHTKTTAQGNENKMLYCDGQTLIDSVALLSMAQTRPTLTSKTSDIEEAICLRATKDGHIAQSVDMAAAASQQQHEIFRDCPRNDHARVFFSTIAQALWKNQKQGKTLSFPLELEIPHYQMLFHPFIYNVRLRKITIERLFKSNAKPALLTLHPFLAPVSHSPTICPPTQVIFKRGDDFRQDVAIQAMFALMNTIWNSEQVCFGVHQVPVRAPTFRCVALDSLLGCCEVVPSTTLKLFNFDQVVQDSVMMDTIAATAAGSYIASWVMGVCDRHNENILVTPDGCVFHIDFGYILGHKVSMDTGPFAITPALRRALGNSWSTFVSTALDAFAVLKQHQDSLMRTALDLLGSVAEKEKIETHLKQTLFVGVDPQQAQIMLRDLLSNAPSSFRTRAKNTMHDIAQKIK